MRVWILCSFFVTQLAWGRCIDLIASEFGPQLITNLAPGQTIQFLYRDRETGVIRRVHASTVLPHPGILSPGHGRVVLAVGNELGVVDLEGRVINHAKMEAPILAGRSVSGLGFSGVPTPAGQPPQSLIVASLGSLAITFTYDGHNLVHNSNLRCGGDLGQVCMAYSSPASGSKLAILFAHGSHISIFRQEADGIHLLGQLPTAYKASSVFTFSIHQTQPASKDSESLIFISYDDRIEAFATSDFNRFESGGGFQLKAGVSDGEYETTELDLKTIATTALPNSPEVIGRFGEVGFSQPIAVSTPLGILFLRYYRNQRRFEPIEMPLITHPRLRAFPLLSIGVQRSGMPYWPPLPSLNPKP